MIVGWEPLSLFDTCLATPVLDMTLLGDRWVSSWSYSPEKHAVIIYIYTMWYPYMFDNKTGVLPNV